MTVNEPHAAASPTGIVPAAETDVLVAGAGIVGLVLGIGLAHHGLNVVLAGRINAHLPGRTVALLNGSIDVLNGIGLWPDLEPLSEPLRVMRIVDDTGSLFRAPPVAFRSEEIGQPWFGRNIRNQDMVEGLAIAAAKSPGLTLVGQHLSGFVFEPDGVLARCEDGSSIRARMLVAADGRSSPARRAAGIAVKSWRYPQTAITAILRHDRPHDGISTEFHTRQGPFTLVPLPSQPEAVNRSSLVWVVDPERAADLRAATPQRLARDIERQSRMLLGAIDVEQPVGSFPITGMIADRMTASRMALVGEAAHVFPPIGAQGLNLGLRDVASLVELLAAAKRQGSDVGAPALLGRYEKLRRGDVALRTMGVDRLNRSLLSGLPPSDFIRAAGLAALAHVGPLRRLAMRAGLGSGT